MIVKNSIWTATAYGAITLLLLIATPFYIRLLGLDQFGIFTLLTALTVPLGVLNAGVGQATTKYVAEFCAVGEYAEAVRLIGTTLTLNIVLGGIGLLLLWGVADFAATKLFNIAPPLIGEARFAFKLVGVVWFLSQISGTYQAVVIGVQRYRSIALSTIAIQTLIYVGGVAVLNCSPRVSSLMLWNIVIGAMTIALWFLLARRSLPFLKFWPTWNRASARVCLNYSIWQMLDLLISTLAGQADRLLLGALTTTSTVAIYGIALSIQSRAVGMVWSVLGTLFPAVSALSTTKDAAERFILQYGWSISTFAAAFYATVFVLGPDFLRLWLGTDASSQAAPILQVLMAVALCGLPSAVLVQFLMGKGLTRICAVMGFATHLVTIGIAIVCIQKYGLVGAAWGSLLGLIVTRPIMHGWIFQKCFRDVTTLGTYLRALHSFVLTALLAAALASFCHYCLHSTFGLLSGFIVSALLTPFLIYFVVLFFERHFMGHGVMVRNLLSQIRRSAHTLSPKALLFLSR